LPAEEKKLKLKSPNFVVSDTRLSVRNLPLSWTERQLKQAFIAAVSQGASRHGLGGGKERVAKSRAPAINHAGFLLHVVPHWFHHHHLNALPAVPALAAVPAVPAVPAVQVKERATKSQPVVKQAKILLDEERPGPDGAPRSKGIGFVEFTEHEHALCALRQLNNNPTAFSKVGGGWRS
jgi:nucleolar protein 4